jgi:hypothetical protein
LLCLDHRKYNKDLLLKKLKYISNLLCQHLDNKHTFSHLGRYHEHIESSFLFDRLGPKNIVLYFHQASKKYQSQSLFLQKRLKLLFHHYNKYGNLLYSLLYYYLQILQQGFFLLHLQQYSAYTARCPKKVARALCISIKQYYFECYY